MVRVILGAALSCPTWMCVAAGRTRARGGARVCGWGKVDLSLGGDYSLVFMRS